MFLKIIPSALIVLFYFVDVSVRENAIVHTVILFALLASLGLFFHYDKRKDFFDEFAKENLRRTDSICLKIVFGISILTIFLQFFTTSTLGRFFVDFVDDFRVHTLLDFSGSVIGYWIVFLILLLTILRAIIFSIIDRRGI
jgi:hypothetical protein